MPRLLRITTVPVSLQLLLGGQFRFMTQHNFEVLTCSANGPEIDEIKKEGVNHAIIPFTRKITPMRDLICLWMLVRLIIRFRPHIVHTHTPKAGLLGMIAAWICRVPVRMHTVAGLPGIVSAGVKGFILRFTEKITCFCAHRVYPNSTGLMQYMKQDLKINRSKLSVLGNGSSNGIDTKYFQKTEILEREAAKIRISHSIDDAAIVFSFLGRLVKDKGIVELVAAFRQISRDTNSYLLLVGFFENDLDPLPAETIRLIDANPRILHVGFQKDVRPWLIASDVFVFPSYREGFPNVVLQASCLEVPSIVSDINGCNEIIQNGKTGIVVKPRDENGLCEAMRTLGASAGLREEYGKQSKEFVTKNFEQKYFWAGLLREYEVLMKEKSCIND